MVTTYYSQTLDRFVTIPDGTVAPCDVCPVCGENSEDFIGSTLRDTNKCYTCGAEFQPCLH